MTEIAVRRLPAGDETEALRFAEAFDDPIDHDATRLFLRDERHHLIVAYVGDHPAGFASTVEILHPDKPAPELFLNETAVIERFRRVGACTALLDELKRLGHELGCTAIWVLTDEGNPSAMAMYAKAGGTWDGERLVMFEYDLHADREMR